MNPFHRMFLRAVCLSNCENMSWYSWDVNPKGNYNLQNSTEFGAYKSKLILHPAKLNFGGTYRFSVQGIGKFVDFDKKIRLNKVGFEYKRNN